MRYKKAVSDMFSILTWTILLAFILSVFTWASIAVTDGMLEEVKGDTDVEWEAGYLATSFANMRLVDGTTVSEFLTINDTLSEATEDDLPRLISSFLSRVDLNGKIVSVFIVYNDEYVCYENKGIFRGGVAGEVNKCSARAAELGSEIEGAELDGAIKQDLAYWSAEGAATTYSNLLDRYGSQTGVVLLPKNKLVGVIVDE